MKKHLWGAAGLALAASILTFVPRAQARPLVNCSNKLFHSPNSVRTLVGWSQRHVQAITHWTDPNGYPLRSCQEAARLLGSAYCKAPNDARITASLRNVLVQCKAWFKRARLAQQARAQHKPVPPQAYGPGQVQVLLRDQLRFVKMYLRDPKTIMRALGKLYHLLQLAPNNTRLAALFDRYFASYYGTSIQEATRLRKAKLFDARLKTWSDSKRRHLAIDLLLGRLANPDTKRLKVSYVDLMYLVEHLYDKAIKEQNEVLRRANCAVWLEERRKDYTLAALDRNLSRCPRKQPLNWRRVWLHPRLRFAMVRVLAKGLADEQKILAQAAATFAGQAGAQPVPMCWQLGNPAGAPAPARVALGEKACRTRVAGYGAGNDQYGRRMPFVMAFRPVPLAKWTGLQVQDAIEFAKQSPTPDRGLIRKLTRAYKKAKKYICVAFTVTMQKPKLSRGWGKLAHYSTGRNHEVSCRKAKRSRKFVKAMPANWTNYFDTVIGGKFTGPWRTIYRKAYIHRHIVNVPVRKERPALIYVRRKI